MSSCWLYGVACLDTVSSWMLHHHQVMAHLLTKPSTFSTPLLPRQPRHQRSPLQPLRSPSPGQPDPHGPRRTHPPPCPPPRTSARRRAWRTSGQTCGPDGPKPRRWRWCCSTCRRRAAPWLGHRQAPRWGAGS